MRYWMVHIVFLAFTSLVAQQVDTYVDKETIQVGESFQVIFTLEQFVTMDTFYMEKFSAEFPAREMTYNEDGEKLTANYSLEVLLPPKDTLYEEGGLNVFKRMYTLTAWDSAMVIIPPQVISLLDSNYLFPPAMIEVTMPKADPAVELYDINELFTELTLEVKENWSWLWISAAALLLAALFILILSKKKKPLEVIQLSLSERTIQAIDELQKSRIYETDLKAYYVELSLLLRNFLTENYAISFRDKTTREIMQLLDGVGVKYDTRKDIEAILGQSDMVKYAKSKPPIADVFVNTEKTKTIVEELAPLELTKIDE
jgi:hypothetical protein